MGGVLRVPRWLHRCLLVLLCCAAVQGCSTTPAATPEADLLTICDSAQALPLVLELAEAFSRTQKRLTLEGMTASGSECISRLQSGTAGVAVVPDWLPDEGSQAFRQTEIARVAIAVMVHESNTVSSLSIAQLRGIFTGGTGDWSQIGGAPMPILVLSRQAGTTARMRFDAVVMQDGDRLTPHALLLPSDEAVVVTVARRPEAIGYAALGISMAGTRNLAVEGLSADALVKGSYPLWQPVVLVTMKEPAHEIASFLRHVTGPLGRAVIQAWGYGLGSDTQ